ncbi:MAG: hypothetical protein R3D67_05165 [Hyphomicrobiaceae bacterium]
MKLSFAAILGAGFVVLSTIATATGNFAVRLEQASKISQQAQVQAQAEAGIDIGRITVTQGPAAGFGRFVARTGPIAPNTGFNIYFEPTGLATRFENGQVRAAMSVDILIRNAANQTVASQDNAWRLPVTHASATNVPLPRVYGDLSVNPLGLPDGRYQIVLRVHDDIGGKFADRVLNIEMRRSAAAGPRLSQARPAGR